MVFLLPGFDPTGLFPVRLAEVASVPTKAGPKQFQTSRKTWNMRCDGLVSPRAAPLGNARKRAGLCFRENGDFLKQVLQMGSQSILRTAIMSQQNSIDH